MYKGAVYTVMTLLTLRAGAQQIHREGLRPLTTATELAATAKKIWPDSSDWRSARWTDEQGVLWLGMMRLWYSSGDGRYYAYVKRQVDRLVEKEGKVATYESGDLSLDDIVSGRLLLLLYEVTEKPDYYRAAVRLRGQLRGRRGTAGGGSWHKSAYQRQAWPDGIYMALPFCAHYALLFHEDSLYDDVARRFAAIERQAGGHSPTFRGWAMGWYGMALIDALDYFPAGHPGREVLMGILQRYAVAVSKAQDGGTGLWPDVPDKSGKPGQPGNHAEASAGALLVYTLARGVRKGYLPPIYRGAAEKGWEGIRNLMGEKWADKDPEGMGAVILAAVETDELYSAYGRGEKTVLLDYYFNNERRKDITGTAVRYHYTWEDRANSGFSLLGHLFRQFGARTDSLPVAPTAENLRKASVYIIVDPDDEREVPDPHYPGPGEIGVIDDWVRAGGVLVLLSNDSANAEFQHFNVLAGTFGIHFNFDDYHKVTGSRYEMGAFDLPAKDAIFRTARRIYIKEMSTLRLTPPAYAHFTDEGHVILGLARVGRGTVFAVGDPWFYNEYTDGRKLPPEYENYNAARDLVQWLLLQAH